MKSSRHMKKMRKTRKSRKAKTHKTKTQRLWKQKGCSSRSKRSKMMGGSCGCGLPFGGMKGGCNGSCGLQQGGSGLAPVPPALVGAPWTPAISGWPGVGGQDGVTNYLSMNKYVPYDPQTQVMQERAGSLFLGKYTGGGKKGMKKSKKRGGGLIPQDLVNFGRTFTYGLGSAYNAINGYSAPVNPLPYTDQLVNTPRANQL
jgi:hypothetical protein